MGDFWRRFCKITGIEQRLSTAFHPETDGATERMNQVILAYLRSFISYAQLEWPKLLPTAQLAINNRDSSITGLSPFYLQHGYHIDPIQQISPDTISKSSPSKRADKFIKRLKAAEDYAAAAMAAAQQQMEEQANKSRNPAPLFKIGDKVWLNLKNIHTPQPKKN